MPGTKLKILKNKSLRAFVIIRKNTPALITVIKYLQFFAVSLHLKFPYLPYRLHGRQPQTLHFGELKKTGENLAIIA